MTTTNSLRILTVSVPSQEVGRAISNALLNSRLVACSQLTGAIESSYWWDGKIETSSEFLLICKTAITDVNPIEEAVRTHHPYETPQIVFTAISEASSSYARWLCDECMPASQKK
jgi:periplasmic divalent cation tolerance protein